MRAFLLYGALLSALCIASTRCSCIKESTDNWTFLESRDLHYPNSDQESCEQKFLDQLLAYGYQFKVETRDCYVFKGLYKDGKCEDCVTKSIVSLPDFCVRPFNLYELDEDSVSLCHSIAGICKDSYKQDRKRGEEIAVLKSELEEIKRKSEEEVKHLKEELQIKEKENLEDKQILLTKKEEFNAENLKNYFQTAFEMCVKNMNPLINAYDHLVARLKSLTTWETSDTQDLVDESVLEVWPYFFAFRTANKDWNLKFAYVPEIAEDDSTYQGTFTYGELSGLVSGSTEYKLYGQSPLSVDGFKKRVKMDGKYKETLLYENSHYATKSCSRIQFGVGNEQYSYQEYQTESNPQSVWKLFRYISGEIEYQDQYNNNDGTGWRYGVQYKFYKNSMTWTKYY